MSRYLRVAAMLVVLASCLTLQGCLFAAAAGGAAGGYEAHKQGYRVQSPVKKDSSGGYKGQSPVTKDKKDKTESSDSSSSSDK